MRCEFPGALLCGALLIGCHDGQSSEPPATDPPPAAAPSCPSDERFASFEWIPNETARLMLVEPGAPELEARTKMLAAFARAGDARLPIVASADLAHFDFELGLLVDQLAAVGLAPAELLVVERVGGARAWVLPSECDLSLLISAMESKWSMSFRETATGRIGRAPEGGFALDVLLLPGSRVALVARGAATELELWLQGSETGLWTESAQAMRGGGLRLGLRAEGLVGTQGSASATDEDGILQIRPGPEGVDIGGSLWTPNERPDDVE